MEIKITTTEKEITANSPYHPDLPSRAKKLGGRWAPHRRAWVFDPRDEEKVRALYRSIYGTDGDDAVDIVDVRLSVRNKRWTADRGALFACGREIARAWGRDSGAKLGAGVILESGEVRSSGSAKNWMTEAIDAVFLVRDVPRPAVRCVPEDVSVEVVDEGKGNGNGNTVIVTRHQGLVDYLIAEAIVPADAHVIAHATPEDLRDKHVVGVLPHNLSCLCASYTEIPLQLTPEMRGRELSEEEVREVAGEPATYKVTKL